MVPPAGAVGHKVAPSVYKVTTRTCASRIKMLKTDKRSLSDMCILQQRPVWTPTAHNLECATVLRILV